MAKYDIDVYGVGRYGPGVPVPFLPDITSGASLPGGPLGVRATVVNPDEVMVRWNQPPQNVFTLIRLVRSMAGPPAWEDDGEILLDAPLGSAVNYLDDGLASARRYYYGVFVFDSQIQEWLRGGYADALVPDATYDHGARMFQLLPAYYQDADRDTGGQLRRTLALLGFELDIAKTEIASLPKAFDMSEGNASAVPLLLRQFGVRPEPELGFGNQRQLVQNLAMLFGSKGSAECLRVLAASVTGWPATVVPGVNLVADNLDAQQDGSIGHWVAGNLASLAYRAGDNSINSPYGRGVVVLTATGTGTAYARCGSGDVWTAVPVVDGVRYGARVSLRGIARPVTLGIDWWSLHGTYLSTTWGTAVTPNIADWSTEADVFGVAPDGAWWGVPVVSMANSAQGYTLYLNGLMVAAVPSAPGMPKYQPARDTRITVLADRINEIRNPRLVTTTWWGTSASADVTASGATLTPVTTERPPPLDENYCGELVTTAAGQGTWTLAPRLRGGSLYSATVWVRVTAGTGGVQMVLRDTVNGDAFDNQSAVYLEGALVPNHGAVWVEDSSGGAHYDDTVTAGTPEYVAVDALTGVASLLDYAPAPPRVAQSATSHDSAWTALEAQLVTGTDDETTIALSLVTDGPCTVRFGAVLLERGDFAPYFDGTIATTTADYMWEGPADASRSHFYRNRTIRSYRFRQLLPRFLPAQQTATLLFAQPLGSIPEGQDLTPGPTTFPGYDTYPSGPGIGALFPSASAYPFRELYPSD